MCVYVCVCAGHTNCLLITVVNCKLLAVQNCGVLALIQGSHVKSAINFRHKCTALSLGLVINLVKLIVLLAFCVLKCSVLAYQSMCAVRISLFFYTILTQALPLGHLADIWLTVLTLRVSRWHLARFHFAGIWLAGHTLGSLS